MKETPHLIEVLRQVLDYNPETGELRWKFRTDDWFASPTARNRWNKLFAGTVLKPTSGGYVIVNFLNHKLKGHRVAWALHYGVWPTDMIDHRDLITSNNRIVNLRDVPRTINNQNTHRGKGKGAFPGLTTRAGRGNNRGWRVYYVEKSPYEYVGRYACFGKALKMARTVNSDLWKEGKN